VYLNVKSDNYLRYVGLWDEDEDPEDQGRRIE
jgi:hypothetical protein